jgi:hypothetical protein
MKLIKSTFGNIRIATIDGIEYGSVYDALTFLGINRNNAKQIIRKLKIDFPEVVKKINHLKFEGRGQRDTPVADLKTLLQICGKTREGYKIDDSAYESLTNLLTNPAKLIEQIDKVHGEGTAKRTADYLDSHKQMTTELYSKASNKKTGSQMIASVHKHNNQGVGLKSKGDRDNMSQNQQNTLTAIQYLQKVKLSESEAKDWKAVNKCKETTDEVLKMLGK